MNIICAKASEGQISKEVSHYLDQNEELDPVSLRDDLALADMGQDIKKEDKERGIAELAFHND